jgi:alpha-tubulin suppressor-like RCC1 family protein
VKKVLLRWRSTGRVRTTDARQRRGAAFRGSRWVGVMAVLAVAAAVAPAPGYASGASAVVGWGYNHDEQLDSGYADDIGANGVGFGEASPVTAVDLSNVASVAAAGNSSFALLTNGTVRSWGGNWKEQLGDGIGATGQPEGARESAGTPVAVLERTSSGTVRELTGVTAIAAAYGSGVHALALVNDSEHEGEVLTWGAGEYGERGNGESGFEAAGSPTPRDVGEFVPHLKHIVAIAAAGISSYALQEEAGKTTLWAWGGDKREQLGTGKEAPQTCSGEGGALPCATEPLEVALPAGAKVTSIAAGRVNAYAVLSTGEVLAWGDNVHGQLGTGTTEYVKSAEPRYVCAVGAVAPCSSSASHLKGVSSIAAGNLFALALREGAVLGWGSNGLGELGGTSSDECSKSLTTCQMTPKLVEGLVNVTAISAGAAYSLALSGEQVYAFGDNERGILGIGTMEGPETCTGAPTPCSRVPTLVAGLSHVSAISAGDGEVGESHALATLSSGSGPPRALTVTAGAHSLTVHWTFGLPSGPHPEYRIRAVPVGTREFTPIYEQTTPCSVEAPCSHEILGAKGAALKEGVTYEVIVGTYIESTKAEIEEAESKGEKEPLRKEQDGWKVLGTPLALAVPTVTGVSPVIGPTGGGTAVVITGTGFVGKPTVKFGSVNALNAVVNSEGSIRAVAPPGTPGGVDVTVTTEAGTSSTSSADRFSYLVRPTVSGINPNQGPQAGGTSVTITGTGFAGSVTVKFGATSATSVTVTSETSITAVSPGGTGNVDVTVTNAVGTSSTSTADVFKYGPQVTGVSPSSGPQLGGTLVTITGFGFTGATAVKFGSSNATFFKVESDTSIVAVSPSGTGTVDVTVTSPWGTSQISSTDHFSYQALP